MIQLTLTIEEVNNILNVLGQLPTNTGAYPLLLKIKQQGDAQVAPPEPQVETEPELPLE
jgi:hypothetical protein